MLLPEHADRVAFASYEVYIDLLRGTGDPAASALAQFLTERIAKCVS